MNLPRSLVSSCPALVPHTTGKALAHHLPSSLMYPPPLLPPGDRCVKRPAGRAGGGLPEAIPACYRAREPHEPSASATWLTAGLRTVPAECPRVASVRPASSTRGGR